MGAWELGTVYLQMRASESDAFTNAPATWPIDVGWPLFYRMGFRVVNGDGPIAAGNLYLQRRVNGGAWADLPDHYGKDKTPGYTDTSAFPPALVVPDWKDGSLTHDAELAGDTVEYRTRLDWTTPGDSLIQTVDVAGEAEDLTESGNLTEFFGTADHGVVASIAGTHARQILGIFDDPGVVAMRIQGRRPSLLCETALVDPVETGSAVAISTRMFRLRGRRRDTDVTRLVLEETT